MEHRTLGKTGIRVSRLGFGAMRLPMVKIGDNDYVDIDAAVDTLRHAFERGVTYVDSGFMYCSQESEIAVGRALRGLRDRVILNTKATKMRMRAPGDLRRMLEHQLCRLDVDYMDFYCFHGIGFDNFRETDRKTGWVKDMLKARDEGLVRHIGFSFHDPPESLPKLVDLGLFEMVTCQYNYLDRKNADGIQYASERGLGVVVMGPVAGGKLAGMPGCLKDDSDLDTSSAASLALRFVISHPGVDVALSGMGSRQMVDENLAAVEAGPLELDEVARIEQLLDKTAGLAKLYCTECGYCMPCPQGVNIPGRFDAMIYHKAYGMDELARNRYQAVRKTEQSNEGKGVCSECGACLEKCPQNIPIIDQLKETDQVLGK